MGTQENPRQATALEINLERTKAAVEIPERYRVLLEAVKERFGVLKRTEELLIELNHPFVNWEFVITQLKGLSVGDFHNFNAHEDGLSCLSIFSDIYLTVITTALDEEVQDSAIRYLFEYLNTVLSQSGDKMARNAALFPPVFQSLLAIALAKGPLLKTSSGPIKTTVQRLVEHGVGVDARTLGRLLYHIFQATYHYWLTEPDPAGWFPFEGETQEARDAFQELIAPLSHRHLNELLVQLEAISQRPTAEIADLKPYLDLPDYGQIQKGYSLIADQLERAEAYAGRHYLVKLDFLFNCINVPGLADIHSSCLMEINRCLGKVLKEEGQADVHDFIRRVFRLLKKTAARTRHQGTVIDCITTLARGVFEQNNHPLVDTFVEELVDFGFQDPDVKGFTEEWQIQANPAYIKNIRSWLEIISLKPRWTKKLLSALIINLKLKGVFVCDTDLLQKDVSGLLNSDILPAFNLVKQLLRLFPIYFSQIGAEGELREISTNVDELTRREDKLIYFLRKQSHVESNSLLVPFIEAIFRFWVTGDKAGLKKHLPPEVYEQVWTSGEYFDGLHAIFQAIFQGIGGDVQQLLAWDMAKVAKEIKGIRGVSAREKERARLMIRFYQLLYKKYFHQHIDLLRDLEAARLIDAARIRALKRCLDRKDHYKGLCLVMDMLAALKEKILSQQKTEGVEDIYYKRHIAVGIPSMYGSYREAKFEALGFMLRLESLGTMLFERLVESLNLKFITKSTLTKIHEYLWLYTRALDLEGIATEGLVAKMRYITSALQIRQFSVDQYIDIFQFIAKGIQDITRDYYIAVHRLNLPIIVNQMRSGNEPDHAKAAAQKEQELLYQQSENFFRSIIAAAFGLQVLDTFVNAIIRTLTAERERFKDNKEILNLVMAYIPEAAVSALHKRNREIDNQILIGNKGYFLKELIAFGFPVPPGFIITTEVFRGNQALAGYKYILKDLTKRISDEIVELERLTGKRFGNPRNPLLLSVRSGATISLPGMMHSFLNVGINEKIAEGLGRKKGYEWATWDSYRRFLQTWGMFHGLERNIFDEIMSGFKQRYTIAKKIQFSPEQMREIALAYRKAMEQQGIEVLDDPAAQLQHAISQVFNSWNSEHARIYRRQIHLSDEWGTAVIVQAMVFGNLNERSGSGVIFTRDPRGSSPNVAIYGDFIFGVQGDDIVSGLVETYPISERQRASEKRDAAISLEQRFPEIYRELVRLAEVLVYEKGFNHQEIEFTFENSERKGLYILQTRDMVQREAGKVKTFKDDWELEHCLLGVGIGVSGGALAGRAVYSEQEIEHFRQTEPETPLILVRPDTVPDDVGIILKVEGLLTARGGSTSHAAVTISQLDKVGVVGFNKLHVFESEGYSVVDGKQIRGGDFIAIDGWSGAIYTGRHAVDAEESYKITL
jgi:pyruvate,orthophosphate dikinase